MKKRISVFAFFSGIGILDLAFERNGYNIVFVNEFDSNFMEAYRNAREQMQIAAPLYGYHNDSAERYAKRRGKKTLIRLIEQEREKGNLVGFIGGPPCPDFSVAGKNAGVNGKNGRLTKTYFDIICRCKPDFFLFENVKGLVRTEKHRHVKRQMPNAVFLHHIFKIGLRSGRSAPSEPVFSYLAAEKAGVFFAFLYSRENKNQSTVFRLESVESAVSSRKSVKYFKGSRKNNYLNGLIILIGYDIIDENKSEVSKMRRFDYRFLKDKAWDNEIVGYLSQIHEQKGKQILYLRQKTADVEKLVEIAKIQSTESSNEIEGIRTTDTRLRQLMSEKTTPRTRDEKEIAGYRDALNTVHENFEYIPLTPNYILQLHKIMFAHTDSAFGGSFKNVQNYISATTADGRTYALFTPLAPYETPEAMRELCDAYNFAVGEGKVDPLLIIPCFIHDFLCIHPFIDGNGRMSRLLTTLLLYRCGYEIGKYISLEAKIARTKESYYDALEASQTGWHEGKDDPTAFIKYLLGTVIAAYRDFEERMELVSVSPLDTVRNAVKTRIGKFTKAEIAELVTSMSATSVERHLRALCENGEIEKRGGGRSTYYIRKTI